MRRWRSFNSAGVRGLSNSEASGRYATKDRVASSPDIRLRSLGAILYLRY